MLRYQAPVAVCTLTDEALAHRIASARPPGMAIVGRLHTENLGIERRINNAVANPHIRFLVLCGADSAQRIGHLPGQSCLALARTRGAPGPAVASPFPGAPGRGTISLACRPAIQSNPLLSGAPGLGAAGFVLFWARRIKAYSFDEWRDS